MNLPSEMNPSLYHPAASQSVATLLATSLSLLLGCGRVVNPATALDESTPPSGPAPVLIESVPPQQMTPSAESEGTPRAVVSRYNYRIDFGPYGFEVDASNGARIVEFSLDGRNVLASVKDSPESYGSTFWLSPQSDWKWPPPLELDASAWSAKVEKDTLELSAETVAKFNLDVVQRIHADRRRGAIVIEYEMTNRGGTPRGVAGWQNSRVRPNGITFYPADEPSRTSKEFEALILEPANGVTWFKHAPEAFSESKKLFADGREGWLAHLDGELLFLKVFPDVPPERQAPNEGEIDIYVSNGGRFVEVEQQGPYELIPPGKSSTWTVHWLARRVPPGVPLEVGSVELVEFARQVAAEVREP